MSSPGTGIGEINILKRLLLPHELSLAQRDLDKLIDRQQENTSLFAEGMAQTSETHHDNAPVEAVRDEQEAVIRLYKPLIHILKWHVIVPYPSVTETSVALGTRVTTRIGNAPPFLIDIVGYLDTEFDDAGDQVSYEAPLARAVIGLCVGESVEALLGGDRPSEINVLDIDQEAVAKYYQDLVE